MLKLSMEVLIHPCSPFLTISTQPVLWRDACAARLFTQRCSCTLTCLVWEICVISLLSWPMDCRKRPFLISFCFSEAQGPLVPMHWLKMQSMSLKKAPWSIGTPLKLSPGWDSLHPSSCRRWKTKPSPGSEWFMLCHKWLIKICHNRSPISRKEVIVYGSCAIWHHSLVYSVLVIKFYRLII